MDTKEILRQQSLLLLNHVLEGNEDEAIACVRDKGIDANIDFDGIPLLSIAAAQGCSIKTIRHLIEYGGANPTATVRAPIKYEAYLPFVLAKDLDTKLCLQLLHDKAHSDREKLGLEPKPSTSYHLGQFAFQYTSVTLPPQQFYLDPEHVRNRLHESDNVLGIHIEPDRMLDLLTNRQEIAAMPKKLPDDTAFKYKPSTH